MTPARVLDTNIISYDVNRHPLAAVYAPHCAGFRLTVCFQSIAELLAGAEKVEWGPEKRARLEHRLGRLVVIESDRDLCECWARIRTVRRHRPISPQDAWIAAAAFAYGYELVTHNPADFADIPGLTVVTAA